MRNARVKIQLTKTDSFRRPSCLALLRPMGVAPIYARNPTLAAVVALDARRFAAFRGSGPGCPSGAPACDPPHKEGRGS
jgi:hypothetical protein